ncbi:MAG: fatty acid desaturase, partial [Pseudomonadota bacterium]
MFLHALPFLLGYTLAPAVLLAGLNGGWWLLAPFVIGWVLLPLADRVTGLNIRNLDTSIPEARLVWHRAILLGWVPVQIALLVWALYRAGSGELSPSELGFFFLGLGVATGGIGITFAHELIHRRTLWERRLGELLLISTAYGHFATEHVFGHHTTVGTPQDPVS